MASNAPVPQVDHPVPVGAEVQREVVRSALALQRRWSELEGLVHTRLLELVPSVTFLPGQGHLACGRVVSALLQAASGEVSEPVASSSLRRVGADNCLDGLMPEDNLAVMHAVLHALRRVQGERWSSATSSLWVEYLIWLTDELRAGASEPSVLQAASARQEAREEEARLRAAASSGRVAGELRDRLESGRREKGPS